MTTKRTRRNLATPNLTVAPKVYSQQYQEQLNNVYRLFFNAIVNQINTPNTYGAFDTGTQEFTLSASTINTAQLVPFSVTSGYFNTKIGEVPTRIYVAETAVYNIQFSAQCNLSSGGSAAAAYFWIRKNGVDVPSTAGKVVVTGPNAETMAAWNYILTLQAGDYIELAWTSSEVHMYLQYNAATSIIPEVPAVILTIMWVSAANNSSGLSQ